MKDVFLITCSDNRFTNYLDFGSDLNLARFREFALKNKGKAGRISFEKPKRTNPQNSYYWTYLGIVERETGNNASDLHDFFKEKLLPKKTITVTGKKGESSVQRPMSTTELDKMQFTDYLDKISALTNVPLPDPEEAGYISN